MKYEGVIFDLDGVICFTDHYHYLAWKSLADSLGIAFDEKKNDRLRGVSRMESLEIVLEGYTGPALSQEEKTVLAEKKNRLYRQYLLTMTPKDLPDEVREALNALRVRGCLLYTSPSPRDWS